VDTGSGAPPDGSGDVGTAGPVGAGVVPPAPGACGPVVDGEGRGRVALVVGEAAVGPVVAVDSASVEAPASEGRDAGVSSVVVVGPPAASRLPDPESPPRPTSPATMTTSSRTAATDDQAATTLRRLLASGTTSAPGAEVTAASAMRADSRRARSGSGRGRGASSESVRVPGGW
jgi:hypothetical protein